MGRKLDLGYKTLEEGHVTVEDSVPGFAGDCLYDLEPDFPILMQKKCTIVMSLCSNVLLLSKQMSD